LIIAEVEQPVATSVNMERRHIELNQLHFFMHPKYIQTELDELRQVIASDDCCQFLSETDLTFELDECWV
jgi:hypothetical protein